VTRTAHITVGRFVAASLATVWRGLTDTELLARWWVPGDIAAVVGHVCPGSPPWSAFGSRPGAELQDAIGD
jgi:uncharacterized protein YndB with AHSA1/START domain